MPAHIHAQSPMFWITWIKLGWSPKKHSQCNATKLQRGFYTGMDFPPRVRNQECSIAYCQWLNQDRGHGQSAYVGWPVPSKIH